MNLTIKRVLQHVAKAFTAGLVIIAAMVIVEGLWAIDFIVSFGHCRLYFPFKEWWDKPISDGSCLNFRYWTIAIAGWFLAFVALWGILKSPPRVRTV